MARCSSGVTRMEVNRGRDDEAERGVRGCDGDEEGAWGVGHDCARGERVEGAGRRKVRWQRAAERR